MLISFTLQNPSKTEAQDLTALELAEVGKGGSVKVYYTVAGAEGWGKISRKTWTTFDKSIATVSDGKISGKKAGEAVVTLTLGYKNGEEISADLPVEVYTPVKSLTMGQKTLTVAIGDEPQPLAVTVKPAEAKYQTVTWTTSDPAVATVDENGTITGKSAGKATIIATATDGTGKHSSVKVVVEPRIPIALESLGRGTFLPNLLAMTVKNLTKTKTIVDYDFMLDLYSYSGILINSGSYSLGKDTKIGPGKTIKRTSSGVGSATKFVVTITGVQFSDGTFYSIPADYQQTWTFRFN